MAERITRRQLFCGAGWKALVVPPQEAPEPPEAAPRVAADSGPPGAASDLSWYFASPMTSYPLLQEMPMDMLLAEARKRGISTENRSKCEIAADIFLGARSSEPGGAR